MKKAARAIILNNQNLLVIKRNKFGTVYYTLPGGGIDSGETADQAVIREIREEASLHIKNPKLVYVEESGAPYGTQYVFVCDFDEGDIKLDPQSIEAQLSQAGQNTYEPIWVPVSKLAGLPFRSAVLQKELLKDLRDGFPAEPKALASAAEISYTGVESMIGNKEE